MSALADLRAVAAGLPARGKLSWSVADGVAAISWSNPTARGAMSAGMMVQLAGAVEELSGRDLHAIVLRCADNGQFCSGGDLRDVRSSLIEHGATMSLAMTELLGRLRALAPVIAVVDGPAVGGGCEIALAAHVRLGSARARFRAPQVRLGVAAGWGGLHFGKSSVPLAVLTELFLRGAWWSQERALGAGLLHGTERDLEGWLEDLRSGSSHSLRALLRQLQGDLADQTPAFTSVWGGPDHQRALS